MSGGKGQNHESVQEAKRNIWNLKPGNVQKNTRKP